MNHSKLRNLKNIFNNKYNEKTLSLYMPAGIRLPINVDFSLSACLTSISSLIHRIVELSKLVTDLSMETWFNLNSYCDALSTMFDLFQISGHPRAIHRDGRGYQKFLSNTFHLCVAITRRENFFDKHIHQAANNFIAIHQNLMMSIKHFSDEFSSHPLIGNFSASLQQHLQEHYRNVATNLHAFDYAYCHFQLLLSNFLQTYFQLSCEESFIKNCFIDHYISEHLMLTIFGKVRTGKYMDELFVCELNSVINNFLMKNSTHSSQGGRRLQYFLDEIHIRESRQRPLQFDKVEAQQIFLDDSFTTETGEIFDKLHQYVVAYAKRQEQPLNSRGERLTLMRILLYGSKLFSSISLPQVLCCSHRSPGSEAVASHGVSRIDLRAHNIPSQKYDASVLGLSQSPSQILDETGTFFDGTTFFFSFHYYLRELERTRDIGEELSAARLIHPVSLPLLEKMIRFSVKNKAGEHQVLVSPIKGALNSYCDLIHFSQACSSIYLPLSSRNSEDSLVITPVFMEENMQSFDTESLLSFACQGKFQVKLQEFIKQWALATELTTEMALKTVSAIQKMVTKFQHCLYVAISLHGEDFYSRFLLRLLLSHAFYGDSLYLSNWLCAKATQKEGSSIDLTRTPDVNTLENVNCNISCNHHGFFSPSPSPCRVVLHGIHSIANETPLFATFVKNFQLLPIDFIYSLFDAASVPSLRAWIRIQKQLIGKFSNQGEGYTAVEEADIAPIYPGRVSSKVVSDLYQWVKHELIERKRSNNHKDNGEGSGRKRESARSESERELMEKKLRERSKKYNNYATYLHLHRLLPSLESNANECIKVGDLCKRTESQNIFLPFEQVLPLQSEIRTTGFLLEELLMAFIDTFFMQSLLTQTASFPENTVTEVDKKQLTAFSNDVLFYLDSMQQMELSREKDRRSTDANTTLPFDMHKTLATAVLNNLVKEEPMENEEEALNVLTELSQASPSSETPKKEPQKLVQITEESRPVSIIRERVNDEKRVKLSHEKLRLSHSVNLSRTKSLCESSRMTRSKRSIETLMATHSRRHERMKSFFLEQNGATPLVKSETGLIGVLPHSQNSQGDSIPGNLIERQLRSILRMPLYPSSSNVLAPLPPISIPAIFRPTLADGLVEESTGQRGLESSVRKEVPVEQKLEKTQKTGSLTIVEPQEDYPKSAERTLSDVDDHKKLFSFEGQERLEKSVMKDQSLTEKKSTTFGKRNLMKTLVNMKTLSSKRKNNETKEPTKPEQKHFSNALCFQAISFCPSSFWKTNPTSKSLGLKGSVPSPFCRIENELKAQDGKDVSPLSLDSFAMSMNVRRVIFNAFAENPKSFETMMTIILQELESLSMQIMEQKFTTLTDVSIGKSVIDMFRIQIMNDSGQIQMGVERKGNKAGPIRKGHLLNDFLTLYKEDMDVRGTKLLEKDIVISYDNVENYLNGREMVDKREKEINRYREEFLSDQVNFKRVLLNDFYSYQLHKEKLEKDTFNEKNTRTNVSIANAIDKSILGAHQTLDKKKIDFLSYFAHLFFKVDGGKGAKRNERNSKKASTEWRMTHFFQREKQTLFDILFSTFSNALIMEGSHN